MLKKRMLHRLTGWTVLIVSLLTVLLAAGCGRQPGQPEKSDTSGGKEIRLGIVPLPHYAHMWIAYKKGFIDEELKKVGFTLKWQPFGLGPMVSEAFAAGHLDMGVMGDFPAFIGRSAGTNYRIVSIASAAPKALALVVKKDSPITTAADLKGKKVATTKAAYGQKLLTLLVEKNGMTMQDIQFVNMTMSDLSTALVRGDVDAGVMWDPLLTRMEESGEIRVIADGTGIYEGYAVVMADEAMLSHHPEAVDAVLTAFQRGKEYLQQHPDESIQLLLEDMKIPQAQLVAIVNKFNYDDTITGQFVADMKDTEKFMESNGLLKTGVDVDSF
ncbi:MAG: aliphatic sulfonate ABC transporter substrate-binding protein, partial [Veillonellales bacterium]